MIGIHYRVWSFFEYGLFRAFSRAQREALSDTLGNALCFEAVDRIRHAQSTVLYLMEFEAQVDGFKDHASKDHWLGDPIYQPLRATGSPDGRRRFLTSAQCAEMRRKRADMDAKQRQMTAAERDRRR
jgi:hypothetical protein